MLGTAKRIVVDKDNTTIIEGAGKKTDIEARIETIRKQIEKTTSDYDREKLQERLAKLTGGVAVIKAGAATETEMKERKDLIDDALHATRAAARKASSPAAAWCSCTPSPRWRRPASKASGDEKIGVDIVAKATEPDPRRSSTTPARTATSWSAEILEKGGNIGYNDATANTWTWTWCRRHHRPGQGHPLGPAERRLRGLLLTTDLMVTEVKEKKRSKAIGDRRGFVIDD